MKYINYSVNSSYKKASVSYDLPVRIIREFPVELIKHTIGKHINSAFQLGIFLKN